MVIRRWTYRKGRFRQKKWKPAAATIWVTISDQQQKFCYINRTIITSKQQKYNNNNTIRDSLLQKPFDQVPFIHI